MCTTEEQQEPKGRNYCYYCKHSEVSVDKEPCHSCLKGVSKNWEAEENQKEEGDEQMENSNNSTSGTEFLKIALVGRMGSGKDTVGLMMADMHDIYPIALAEPIRDIVKNYFPTIYNSDKGARRGALQHIGESFRQLDPEVWITEVLEYVENAKHAGDVGVCISDCRLQVELHRLKQEGFYIVYVDADLTTRVNRLIARGDGTTTLDQLMHSTETDVQYYECHTLIDNDGNTTLEELEAQVKQIVKQAKQFHQSPVEQGGEF